MRKYILRLLAICMFLFNLSLQLFEIFYTGVGNPIWFSVSTWIREYELRNLSMLYFIAALAGGEIWGLIGFALIIILYFIALIGLLFNKKRLFWSPLLIMIADIMFSLYFMNSYMFSVFGILYKLLSAALFAMLILYSKKEKF